MSGGKKKFCVEYKAKKKDLNAAYLQLLQYHDSLENPPLLICLDTNRFEIHTKFTGAISRTFSFDLDQLLKKKRGRRSAPTAPRRQNSRRCRCCAIASKNPEPAQPAH
jgi:hypothetical protein